ncbi:MAG: hypothetical protein ACHQX4_03260 [Gemmatimonadales bacterium]
MKPAHTLTIAFLVIVALAHALRLLLQWELVINRVTIAMWPSVLAVVVCLGLAVALWRESRHTAA